MDPRFYALATILFLIGLFLFQRKSANSIVGYSGGLDAVPAGPAVPAGMSKKLVYSNGDTLKLYDAWRGNIPPDSVFSPLNPWWYFDISGLSDSGELIFSTGWHYRNALNQRIPPFEQIKRWQITVATNISSPVPPDVYDKLQWV